MLVIGAQPRHDEQVPDRDHHHQCSLRHAQGTQAVFAHICERFERLKKAVCL
jgi:hypothetical protein